MLWTPAESLDPLALVAYMSGMPRRHNFQTVSWFYDLANRKLLDMEPPYQRRSVWNQSFKDYFVDTVLLNLPAPAIFLYEDITPDGRSIYHVVDGKQRLTTLLEFVAGEFPVGDKSELHALRGKYFTTFDDSQKKAFWAYQFLVEYVPSDDEKLINGIFDRINRNVAKLTPQELRHARLSGDFITVAESLAEWMTEILPKNFPRLLPQSRMQMKDIELVALLLLFIEDGAKSYSQDDLDAAFTKRDVAWERRHEVESAFRAAVALVDKIVRVIIGARDLSGSRLRNQADFYSLFGAVHEILASGGALDPAQAAERLNAFLTRVDNEEHRAADQDARTYYDAARSASSDKGPRETRIAVVRRVLAPSNV